MIDDTQGLQKDADTIILLKGLDEKTLGPGIYNEASGIADETGNYPMEGSGLIVPIGNGPLDDAGIVLATPQFSRVFVGNAAGFIKSASAIDQAANDAIRSTFTQQIMFKQEWVHDSQRTLFGIVNNPSVATADDWLAVISITAAGHIQAFWESQDTDSTITTTATAQGNPPVQIAKWQVLTIVWTPAATGYDLDFYIHTLDSPGVVTGGLIETLLDQGLLPVAASGVGGSFFGLGSFTDLGPATWLGNIGFARIFEGAVSDVEGEAEELLLTGTLAAGVGSDLIRLELNEPPDLVDRSSNGLHLEAQWVMDYGAGTKHIDLVGSGGRSRRTTGLYARLINTTLLETLKAKYGLINNHNSFFNADIDGVPEYTMQWWGWLGGAGNFTIADWEDSGESLATNFLLQFGLNVTTGELGFFAEFGSGSNITRTNISGLWSTGLDITEQAVLITIRMDEKPGSPGTLRGRISVNDSLDEQTFDATNIPAGGSAGAGLRIGWHSAGLLQEYKFSCVAISDAQVLADAARCQSFAGGGGAGNQVAPVIQNVIPADGTELALRSTPLQFDVIDLDPGIAAILVTIKFQHTPETFVAYDGSQFLPPYNTAGSTVTAITDGFRFTVAPVREWPSDIADFFVYAIDADGNIEALP